MPRLPVLTCKDVIKVLERAGFCFERQRGSHRIFVKDSHLIVVPWHSGDMRKGTLRDIINQSGMTVEEFLALL